MARSRTIKYGFFKNEDLPECSPLARLLFIALWCLADREGRLEDRPRKLKGEIFPYEDCNVDELLNELRNFGFINRYTVNDIQIVQVVNFAKHQNPHKNEAESIYPAFIDGNSSNNEESSEVLDACTEIIESVQGTIENNHDFTREVSEDTHTNPACYLSPCHLSLDIKTHVENADAGECENQQNETLTLGQTAVRSKIPYPEITAAFNKTCVKLPQVVKLTASRKVAMKRVWEDCGSSIDAIRQFFERVDKSEFLSGGGSQGWKADFDWIMKDQNYVRIVEGKFDNGDSKQGVTKNGRPNNFNNFENNKAKYTNDELESMLGVRRGLT